MTEEPDVNARNVVNLLDVSDRLRTTDPPESDRTAGSRNNPANQRVCHPLVSNLPSF